MAEEYRIVEASEEELAESVGQLGEEQKEIVRSRIKAAIAVLNKPSSKTAFGNAARWTLRIYAFLILAHGPSTPRAGFGATFEAFGAYITRKDKEREEEEIAETMEDE